MDKFGFNKFSKGVATSYEFLVRVYFGLGRKSL